MVAGGEKGAVGKGNVDKKMPKLQSVQETDELVSAEAPSPRPEPCGRFFGIKSHLHNFYEHISEKDPRIYEEYEEYR